MNLTTTQYDMLMGNYKQGNYPKEFVNEAASQISKLSTALCQYKADVEEEELINNLMEQDLLNMIEEFKHLAKETNCLSIQLTCSLVVIKCQKIIDNRNFNLKNLL